MSLIYALVARGKTVLAEFTATSGNIARCEVCDKVGTGMPRVRSLGPYPRPNLFLPFGNLACRRVIVTTPTFSGNFPTVTRSLLAKIPSVDGKMSYVYDNVTTFHYCVSRGEMGIMNAREFTVVHRADERSSTVSYPSMVSAQVEGGITYLCMSSEMVKRRVPFAFLDDIRQRFRQQFGEAIHTAMPFELNESFSPVLRSRIEFFNHDPSADRINQVGVCFCVDACVRKLVGSLPVCSCQNYHEGEDGVGRRERCHGGEH